MKNFVLLKRFGYKEGAVEMATMLLARLDGCTVAYSLGWSWMATTKTYPNGVMGQGPTILVCGKCDVLAIRSPLAPDGGSDIYCTPNMKDWIEGGMQGDPPPPELPADGGIIVIGTSASDIRSMASKLRGDR